MNYKFQLKLYPDSVLRDESLPVTEVNGSVHNFIKAVAEIMYSHNGIGLAAPQVGVLQRIIIIDIGEGLFTLINPEIIEQDGQEKLEEGCLSLPGI